MTNEIKFHHIQKSIILSLASKSPARFSELQPPRLPNNTFSYHLKKLLDSGYVELTDKGYVATRKALKLVVFGTNHEKTKASPSMISIIYVLNDKNEVLLINRDNKPFQGWYGMPSGLIHVGETLQQAARRELFEKTTLVAQEDLDEVGVLDFRYLQNETQDIFIHVVAFVYKYTFVGDGDALNDKTTKYGQLSWSNLGRSHILPEVFAVKSLVDADVFTHASVSFAEPSHLAIFSA